MQSYFIAHTDPRERGLRGADIPFEPFQIGGQRGLVFADGYLTRALAALNSQVEDEDRSPYDGIRVLRLRRGRGDEAAPPAALAEVKITHEGGASFSSSSQHNRAAALLKEFGSRFDVDEVVLIENNSKDGMSPRTGTRKLHVFLWASPRGRAEPHGSATRLWEHHISDDREHWNCFSPSGMGEVIRDDAGTAVAEVLDNNLYVLYPINDEEIGNFASIFRRILEEALLLRGTPEQRAARAHQREARRLEEIKIRPVVVDRWDASRSQHDKFVAVATEFAPIFGKQIHIHNYCTNPSTRPPINNGCLHIYIWASPGNTTDGGSMPATLFGAPLKWGHGSSCILKPMGEEGQLLTDEDENQIGKMIGDTVYIHYPLGDPSVELRWDNKGPDALFRRMLEEIVFFRTATEEQKSARTHAIAARQRPKSREAYIRSCNGRFDKALESTRAALKGGPAEVEALQEQLVRKIREQVGLQRKLAQMENCRGEAVEVYGKEFDKLLETPKIRDVRVRDGVIQVFTDTLFCVDPRSKKKHEIGHFRIEFSSNGSVRWYNLARQVNGYENRMQAPHVFSNGNACLGNAAEIIPELAANYEFAALAMVCIQFVESVNTDDAAGRHINLWPVAAS